MTKVLKQKFHILYNQVAKIGSENCLTSTEDCEGTKNEPELIFSPNQVYGI